MNWQNGKIFFKECPRCGGDIHCDSDVHGKYFSCMQCGYLKDVNENRAAVENPNGQSPSRSH